MSRSRKALMVAVGYGILTLGVLGLVAGPASAGAGTTAWSTRAQASATPAPGVPDSSAGYQLVASDGGVFSENTPFEGSAGGTVEESPIVGGAATPTGDGYWIVTAQGAVLAFGDAVNHGSVTTGLDAPIVGMAADPATGGYWLVASDGGVFSFDAPFEGSTGNVALNKPIVAMAADPATGGYWLVASDGGVFSFDAPFEGSTGDVALNRPIVGMAADPATGGYWLVASDGGVFSFDAPFEGSTGDVALNRPIVGMAADPATGGYWLVASDGGVFSFDAPFEGSTGNVALNKPIVAIVPTGPATPSTPGTCATNALSLSLQGAVGGLDHAGYILVATNEGAACALSGYPAVTGEEDGTPVVSAAETPDGYLGGLPQGATPAPVTLATGQSASALFEGLEGPIPGTACPAYDTLTVVPPGDTQPATLSIPYSLCAPQIHPIVPGTTGDAYTP